MPLVNKDFSNKLVLQGYTLDSGHFFGLTEALKNGKKSNIEQVLLENCGIDDNELSILLTGFMALKRFESFIYK